MWKFCGKAQFPHSFGRFTRNYVETVLFHKISTPGSQVKLRHFKQCYCEVFKSCSDLGLKLWFCKVVPFGKKVNQLIEYACYCSNDVLHNNIKKPSRFRSDNSRRKIYIYIFFIRTKFAFCIATIISRIASDAFLWTINCFVML